MTPTTLQRLHNLAVELETNTRLAILCDEGQEWFAKRIEEIIELINVELVN